MFCFLTLGLRSVSGEQENVTGKDGLGLSIIDVT
jgi:hypothetical protein